MAGRTGKIVAYVLCGTMLVGHTAVGMQKKSSKINLLANYSKTELAELGTAIAKASSMAMYRCAQGKYKKGKRAKKPVYLKTLVDALRVANGSFALYNNWDKQDHKTSAWDQKYTELWTLIDSAKLLMDILPSKISERIIASYDDEDEYLSSSLFGWVNQKINDSKFLESLSVYVLPVFEEIATIGTAIYNDKSEKAQLIKLYVAGAKGALRCWNEFLDTKNPKLRGFYFLLFVAHLGGLGCDIYDVKPLNYFDKKKPEAADKAAADKAAADKAAADKAAADKAAADKAVADKAAADKAAADKAVADKAAADKAAAEKAAADKAAAEKAAAEKAAAEKAAAEKAAAEKAAADKAAADKAAADKAAADKAAADKAAAEKAAAENAAAEEETVVRVASIVEEDEDVENPGTSRESSSGSDVEEDDSSDSDSDDEELQILTDQRPPFIIPAQQQPRRYSTRGSRRGE